MSRTKDWTKEEDHILKENYPHHRSDWPGWEKLLPNRSSAARRARANRLLVRKPKQRGASWSEDDERLLLINLIRLSRTLDRSPLAVVRHAEYLVRSADSRVRLKSAAI